MISDDLRVTALNTTKVGPDSNNSGKANWVLTVMGVVSFSYITRVTPYVFEPGKRHIPHTILPKLNYCLQKLCMSQKSELYKAFGTDDQWEAYVKISATMDQNMEIADTPVGTLTDATQIEYEGPETITIAQEVTTGQRCPDLGDVKKALEKVIDVPWWELNGAGKVVGIAGGVKFNEIMDCEKEPPTGVKQGALDDQEKTDKETWVDKGQAAAYDKLEKSIASRLFQGFADGFGVSVKVLTYGLRFLNILHDELNPPKYKRPDDPELCKCSGSGLNNDCWRCRYVEKEDGDGNKEWVAECLQDVKRVKGECPLFYVGADWHPTYETKLGCEDTKDKYCPPGVDPPNQ